MEKPFKHDLSFTQNRELSWLAFNRRVLDEAFDPEVPPMEKLKFVSIFVSNLDEFFMVRVGSLFDLSLLKNDALDNKTGWNYAEQLDEIYKRMPELYQLKDSAYEYVEELLRAQGIANLTYEELTKEEKKYVDAHFDSRILPVISPLIVDSHHPFPHLPNNRPLVVANLKNDEGESFMGIVTKAASVNNVLFLPGEQLRYILVEEILLAKLPKIFSYKVSDSAIVSVTRNADLDMGEVMDDVEEDFRKHMKKALKKRARLEPVRLEVKGKLSKKSLEFLMDQLGLGESQVYHSATPLKMSYVYVVADKLPANLEAANSFPKYTPYYPSQFNPRKSMIDQVTEKDRLLFFPFESMDPFLALLKEASNDPYVISIKITIYRLSSISKVAEYLANAAENGKEVTAVMELRARFDEDNNINWSERLEQAGCTLIYGFEDYKIHSKICLITRHKEGKVQYISQFGTGNYNEKTAKLYTDLSLMTANQELGLDAQNFFRNMMIGNLEGEYKHLLVAPNGLKPALLNMIDEQIQLAKEGKDAMIRMKCNSVTERDVINKLSEASIAGVKIFLNVRGICCLVPGIEGKTENIRVTSIVGRYLEHPRIYIFGQGEEAKMYISSADLMTRNIVRRVEIACPIYDPEIRREVESIMDVILNDDKKATLLLSDGSYVKVSETGERSSQEIFMNMARELNQGSKVERKEAPSKAAFRHAPSKQIAETSEEEMLDRALSKLSFWDKLKRLFFS